MSDIQRYSVIETALCIGGRVLDGEVSMVRASEYDAELAEKEATWTARFELLCEGAIRPIVLERNAAQAELAALREELAQKDAAFEDLLQSNSDMTTCLKSSERHESHCLLLDPEEPDCHCTCAVGRLTAAEQRNAALAEFLSKGFNCMERSSGKYRITMDFRTGDECFEAYSAICNLCHCDSLVREPQPTESGASE